MLAVADGVISRDDPRSPDVVALLERHLAFGAAHSPPEDVHALDVDGLLHPSVSFYSLRNNGALVGVGAGALPDVLKHLLGVARSHGASRVRLETGSMDAFAPARTLYASAGFEVCPPFGDYTPRRLLNNACRGGPCW